MAGPTSAGRHHRLTARGRRPTSETLRQHLAALHDDGYQNVVPDLSGVTFCDSTGLGTVATHAKRVMESGGKLVVAGLRPDVSAVFDISGLSQAIPIAETVHKAEALSGEDGPS